MKKVETKDEVREVVRDVRCSGGSIGVVPTMGYLHEGHMALVKVAHRGNHPYAAPGATDIPDHLPDFVLGLYLLHDSNSGPRAGIPPTGPALATARRMDPAVASAAAAPS